MVLPVAWDGSHVFVRALLWLVLGMVPVASSGSHVLVRALLWVVLGMVPLACIGFHILVRWIQAKSTRHGLEPWGSAPCAMPWKHPHASASCGLPRTWCIPSTTSGPPPGSGSCAQHFRYPGWATPPVLLACGRWLGVAPTSPMHSFLEWHLEQVVFLVGSPLLGQLWPPTAGLEVAL